MCRKSTYWAPKPKVTGSNPVGDTKTGRFSCDPCRVQHNLDYPLDYRGLHPSLLGQQLDRCRQLLILGVHVEHGRFYVRVPG